MKTLLICGASLSAEVSTALAFLSREQIHTPAVQPTTMTPAKFMELVISDHSFTAIDYAASYEPEPRQHEPFYRGLKRYRRSR